MNKILKDHHMEYIHTDAGNCDFRHLVSLLDDYYYQRYGEIALKYRPYNMVENIKDVYIIYCEKNPVACGCFKRYSEDTAEIKRIYVLPEYRKNSLASKIMELCENEAKKARV